MIAATLPPRAGFEAWRARARTLMATGVPPEEVAWRTADAPDLFAARAAPLAREDAMAVSRRFVEIARKAVLHRDAERFALLYRVLWRLHRRAVRMSDAADRDVARIEALAKSVRRDEHKMHAFVRFREVETQEGARFVAWFEPQHHIVEESAPFFVRRFAGMVWSIVTPEASAHWDGEELSFGPGGGRGDVPAEDARDADWRAYYRSMFNPARLKVAAMTREMPKHYWRNLPEAQDIVSLIRDSGARAEAMVSAAPTAPKKRAGAAHAMIAPAAMTGAIGAVAERRAPPQSLADLNGALAACRACPLWKDATQVVVGEGATSRPLIAFVGEQPGDQEDLSGRPFVGPAGQVFDRVLRAAGVDRSASYVTNAVKHFKHEVRGKRRLHQRPNAGEVETCRWWVEKEIALVRPTLVVALGATALRSLSAYEGPLDAVRGRTIATREGAALRAVAHPSYVLRLPDAEARDAAFATLVNDLQEARAEALALSRAPAP
jgi:DNA polymerase